MFLKREKMISFALTFFAAALLLVSLKFPLWHLRMEAPQYRDEEALKVAVFPNAMRGDLKELAVLNQYIGVHVPSKLPQFKWLPGALIAAAALGIGACLLGGKARRRALVVVAVALTLALVFAAAQARMQMRHIGHHRDRKAAMLGVHDFTPPFLGTTRIAQFEVSSRFGLGAWLIGGALALQLTAAGLASPKSRKVAVAKRIEIAPRESAGHLATTAT
ncbi:MAG TPA: hypothetical protein VFM25_11605 [Verrucomicrobiae bacterium]|nr:hypothetical protein [Verrucomicrobiae bacterium]